MVVASATQKTGYVVYIRNDDIYIGPFVNGLKEGKVNFHGDSAALHSHFHSHPVGQVRHKHTHTEVD